MKPLEDEIFVCLDCETTGLDPKLDRIIEIAVVKFDLNKGYERFESLIDPEAPIPESSAKFHHITDDMVKGKPKINEVIPEILELIGRHIVVGHGVGFDIDILATAAERASINCTIRNNQILDTLRMARMYGESPTNSLEQLRRHFNIPQEGAHRAMNDVIVNIEVFKYLAKRFKTLKQLLEALSKPVLMKVMPLGKHKGRSMNEVPLEYLLWAARKEFDQDLLFSIRSEISRRKKGGLFTQVGNPFSNL